MLLLIANCISYPIDVKIRIGVGSLVSPSRCAFRPSLNWQSRCSNASGRLLFPFAFVVADTVYGGNEDLRTWLEAHQYSCVLAVPCNEPVGIRTLDGQRKRMEVREVEALRLHVHDWQRLSMSEGTRVSSTF
jgi:hypothetical protein